MRTTLPVSRADDNAGTGASVAKQSRRWTNGGKSDPVARYAAPQMGLQPRTVEHRLRSLPHECAAIIHAFKQLGDEERLAKFVEPIDRARDGREPPPNVEATWTACQHADAIEDVAELRYSLDKSDKNLAALIKAKRETVQRETAAIDMLLEIQRQRERA